MVTSMNDFISLDSNNVQQMLCLYSFIWTWQKDESISTQRKLSSKGLTYHLYAKSIGLMSVSSD